MNQSMEIALFLLLIILVLICLLCWEHRRRKEQQAYFHWLCESAKLYVFNYDSHRDIMYLSAACATILQLPETISSFSTATQQLTTPFAQVGINFLKQSMQNVDKTSNLCLTYDNSHTCFYRVTAHRFYDKNQKLRHTLGFFYDVTIEMKKEQRLERKAATDQLTGVYNRGAIHELIQLALRENTPGAFIMLDIDYFKAINDSAGHQAGDEVLRSIVRVIREHIRHTDIVGRMGGDEFCIYLPNVPSREFAQTLCERIRSAIPAGVTYGSQHHPVTMSIGCTLSKPTDNFTSLYSRADSALYQSKRQGRDKVTIDQD
ncbi:diguanylate cyclase (GGDEF) domain-containing protein [Selenomonas sp. GACV-9]|nr:diguanylate cyclase (GGDEF) domain-containing protein [Selenomonas ruminantium]